jgi:hypothetical protein
MESKHPPAIDLELTLLNCAGAAMYSDVLLPTTDDKVSYSGGVPILAGREREELRASIRRGGDVAVDSPSRRHRQRFGECRSQPDGEVVVSA